MNYKGSYIEELTNEVTTLELEYVEYDRWGEHEYADDDVTQLKIIRASKYSSKGINRKELYQTRINAIAQHALNEITMLPDEVVARMVKKLEQHDEHIDAAWKVYFEHWQKFSDGKFSALDFQWTFFHYFNIPVYETAGIMENPDFPGGKTTDNFFWDLHDAMMYKQGAIKLILWNLRNQLGMIADEHGSDTTCALHDNPDMTDNTDKPNRNHPLTLKQLALIEFYKKANLDKDKIKELIVNYGHNSVEGFENELRFFGSRSNRIKKMDNKRSYSSMVGNYRAVIQVLAERELKNEYREAVKEFEEFNQNNMSHNS